MMIDLLQALRIRLEREETRREAAEELATRAPEWVDRAREEGDWELLSDLFSLELVAIRTGARTAEEALRSFLPFMDTCPMSGRIAAELQLMDDVEAGLFDEIRQRADMAWTMGRSLEDSGQVKGGLAEYLIGRSWLNSLPPGEDDPGLLGTFENSIGSAWLSWNELERSLAAYRRGLSMDLRDDPDTRACLENNLGLTLRQMGRAQEAVEAFHRALEFWSTDGDPCSERLSWLSAAEGNLGSAYADLGDTHRALARQRRTVQIQESLYQREPTLENLEGLAGSLSNLGNALRQQGMLEEGTAMNRRARDLIAGAARDGKDMRDRLAVLELSLANALSMGEQYEEAAHSYRAAIMIWRELHAEGRPGLLVHIGLSQSNLAMTFASRGEHEQALDFQKVAISTLESAQPEDYDLHHLARAFGNLGYLHDIRGSLREAAAAYGKSCALWQVALEYYPAGLANLAMMERSLANLYLEFGDYEKATPLLVEALKRYHELVNEQGQLDLRDERATTAHMLGDSYFRRGLYSAAGASLTEACELWARLDGYEVEERESKRLLEEARTRAEEAFPPF